MMRYLQSREESVSLVRQVLAAMGQHDAAFNPVTFAVFYDHLAGINPPLSQALSRVQRQSPRLDNGALHRLYDEHVADAGAEADGGAADGTRSQRIQVDMQRLMKEIAQSAERTGHAAGLFDEQLEGLSNALRTDRDELVPQLDAAREGTQVMRDSVHTLQQQVQAAQREIERLRADLERTREESMLDPLTQVLNRRGFDQRMQFLQREPPPEGCVHGLVMIDIDHFKRVNDQHGHTVGDRVLAGLGTLLRTMPQEPGMTCARYGGEEFAILLPATTLDKAKTLAETVRTRVRGIRLRDRQTQAVALSFTVSAGVAAWRVGEDLDTWLSCADAALYRAKAAGRDRVVVA